MGDSATILVVDDEADLREAVSEYLSRRGFTLLQAPNAAQARQLLYENTVDVVILDITMPGEDGLSLARALRASGSTSGQGEIGILMLSSATDVMDRVLGLELGADDYIVKPADLRELLARIRAVLRRREVVSSKAEEMPMASTRRVGRHRLNLEARRLTSATGVDIPLGPGEYALLKAFVERPGRVLSREQLLGIVHPRGEELFDRAIDVRIARLRQKIETTPGRPSIIRTVRGEGYVFDPNAAG